MHQKVSNAQYFAKVTEIKLIMMMEGFDQPIVTLKNVSHYL